MKVNEEKRIIVFHPLHDEKSDDMKYTLGSLRDIQRRTCCKHSYVEYTPIDGKAGAALDMTLKITALKQVSVQTRKPLWL